MASSFPNMDPEDSKDEPVWVRFEPPLLPGAGVLTALLAEARPGHRATAIDFIDRGVVNSNYRVRIEAEGGASEGALLLRLSRSLEAGRREAAVARALQSRLPGLVAPPLAAVTLSEPEPHEARLLEWIDGTPLDEAAPNGDSPGLVPAAHDLARALTAVHAVRCADFGRLDADFAPAPPSGGHPPSRSFGDDIGHRIHLRLENPAHGLDEAVAESLEALLDRLVGRLDDVPPPFPCLVHGDLSPGNILLRREGDAWRLAGLIDWGMTRAAVPAVDHASLQFEAGARWPNFVSTVLEASGGVSSQGEKGDAAFALARLLLLLDARMVALVRRSGDHLAQVDAGLAALVVRHGEGH